MYLYLFPKNPEEVFLHSFTHQGTYFSLGFVFHSQTNINDKKQNA